MSRHPSGETAGYDDGFGAGGHDLPNRHAADAMSWYLNEIGKYPLIDQKEVVELCKDIEAGLYARHKLDSEQEMADPELRADLQSLDQLGRQAKEKLICANLRLVVSWAKRYRGTNLDMSDLVSYGNLGLIRAVEKYDYKLGYRFSTYATWWINQQIQRGVIEANHTVHIPAQRHSELKKLKKAEEIYGAQSGNGRPCPEALAELAGLSVDHVRYLQDIRHFTEVLPSLDESPFEEGDGSDYYHILPAPDAQNPEDIFTGDDSRALEALLNRLAAIEREVITRRFGLEGGKPASLSETAEAVGLSPDDVKRMTYRALDKLRRQAAGAGEGRFGLSELKFDRVKRGRWH